MTPTGIDSFLASLEGKPMLFASNVKVKEVDSISARENTNVKELNTDKLNGKPWPTSFSLTATMECDTMSRAIHKLMGTYRPNRGSSKTLYQKFIQYQYYLNKINRKENKK